MISDPQELSGVVQNYPGLVIAEQENGSLIAAGPLAFSANYQEKGVIEDVFDMQLIMPPEDSTDLPTARELSGRIPNDFHTNHDGSLCLAPWIDIRQKRMHDPSLRAFIEDLVIPFLYSFSFKEQTGELPFGEFAHGGRGTLDHYKEILDTTSDLIALNLLKAIVQENYRGHVPCPCGSKTRTRKCHGKQLRELKGYQTRKDFLNDLISCLEAYVKSDGAVPSDFFSNSLIRYWNEIYPDASAQGRTEKIPARKS